MTPLEIYLTSTIAGLITDGVFAKWERFAKYKGLFTWLTNAGKIIAGRK